MGKTLSILIGLTFMLGGLAAISPGTNAQTANDLAVDDPSGDVVWAPGARLPFLGETGPEQTPVVLPGEVSGPMDITEFRVEGETATALSFALSVADFSRPNMAQPQNVDHFICFEYTPTGATYRFLLQFGFPLSGSSTEVNAVARFDRGVLQRMSDGDCSITDTGVSKVESGISFGSFTHEYLPQEGKLTWTLPRSLLAELPEKPGADAEPVMEPRPSTGDQLKGLKAVSLAWASATMVAYDETDANDFTFAMDTGNEEVRVIVPSTVRATAGVGGFDTPIYGVEIGSFQTIPVTIENDLPNPIEPTITVNILSGEATKWEIRTLPSIKVPAASGDNPGKGTVTLIVNADPTVNHKDTVRLLVTALDEEHPHLGAQAVDVVAVAPPTPAARTVYFHGTGDPCQPSNRWINTLQNDDSSAEAVPFRICDPTGGGGGTGVGGAEVGLVFRPDVPFARDYVLSTTQQASASIFLSSTRAVVGTDERVGVPMVADVTVQILSGSVVIGENTVTENLEEEAKPVNVNVDVMPRMLGGFGREVPDESGLRVRVVVEPIKKTLEVGGCIQDQCTPIEHKQDVESPTGEVRMNYGQSKVDLPIASSERSGDLINITASGALMSLRAQGERDQVTNPGRIVVYNLTVQNEGVNLDTAQLEVKLNRTGWKAEILPKKEFQLEVGEPRSFNIKVTAPADGREGQKVRVDVFARSLNDAEASTRLPLTVEITTGQQFENQEIDPSLQDVENEESPAAPVAFLLGVLALLGVGLRRRR